jgi:opacity protein-like surface antigen
MTPVPKTVLPAAARSRRARRGTGRLDDLVLVARFALRFALLSAGVSTFAQAQAQVPAQDTGAEAAPVIDFPNWTFGGYGTLGVAHSSERNADYTANVINPGNLGATRRYSADVDSRLGAQLGLNLDRQWSATVQVVAERNLQNSYRPSVEWANVKYQATPDFSIRVGRIALPTYLASDYRKAGYALPWARPPVEVYGALPVSNSDGVDLSYRWSGLGLQNHTQAFYGRTEVRIDGRASHANARQLAGLTNTTTSGALTVRASAMTADLTVDLGRPLFDAFRQFGSQGAAIAERYSLDHKRVAVGNLGASYEPGNWFIMSEISRLNARSFLGDKTAFYASAGLHLGNFTPYMSYAKVKSSDAARRQNLDLSRLPPQAAPSAAFLNSQLNGLLSTIAIQQTVTAGLRWDFLPDRALKIQYDRLLPQGGSSGTLNHVQPGFESGRPVHVIGIALDFVF